MAVTEHRFINRYRYDKEAAKEAMGAYWRWKNRKAYWVLGVMVAFFTILSPIFETEMFLIPALIGVIGFVSLFVQESQSISKERSNIRQAFKTDAPWLKIEIDDETIHTTVSNTQRKVSIDNIVGYKETKNMYVVFLRGQLTIAMKKDSFELGTGEAFKAFLDMYMAEHQNGQKTA
ncbi:MAG: YcxB family protein [Bilifractor sp.]|jgi:hypothetical protein|nr:YcxB family protein [Lachnospiraceae bacterium]